MAPKGRSTPITITSSTFCLLLTPLGPRCLPSGPPRCSMSSRSLEACLCLPTRGAVGECLTRALYLNELSDWRFVSNVVGQAVCCARILWRARKSSLLSRRCHVITGIKPRFCMKCDILFFNTRIDALNGADCRPSRVGFGSRALRKYLAPSIDNTDYIIGAPSISVFKARLFHHVRRLRALN